MSQKAVDSVRVYVFVFLCFSFVFLWACIFKVAGPGTAKRLIIALKVEVRDARSSP